MLDQLPPHLISKILKFLSIQDLARVCLTNVTLKALAEDNWQWRKRCRELCQDKQIDKKFLEQPCPSWKRQYHALLVDALRTDITLDELTTLIWHFTFKGSVRHVWVFRF